MTPFPQVVWFHDPKKGGKHQNRSFGMAIAWMDVSNGAPKGIAAVIRVFAIDGLPERFESIRMDSLTPSSHVEFAEFKRKHGL